MSAYTTLKTRLISAEHLVAALTALGYTRVEHHATPQPLVGWFEGDAVRTAEVILRKADLEGAGADIGFARDAEGFFAALIDDMDRGKGYGLEWMQRLNQYYAYAVTRDTLARQGFDLAHEETRADQSIHLTLRRMS